MTREQSDETMCENAALFALGALGPTEAPAFERHLAGGCSRCNDELAAFTSVANDLSLAATPVAGSSAVRARLLGEVRRLGRRAADQTVGTMSGAMAFVGTAEGQWLEIQPGILRKDLATGGGDRSSSYLIRMHPGAVAETHIHAGVEHCYVIEGDLIVGERTITGGDFHLAGRGTEHAALRSDGGCLLLIVEAPA